LRCSPTATSGAEAGSDLVSQLLSGGGSEGSFATTSDEEAGGGSGGGPDYTRVGVDGVNAEQGPTREELEQVGPGSRPGWHPHGCGSVCRLLPACCGTGVACCRPAGLGPTPLPPPPPLQQLLNTAQGELAVINAAIKRANEQAAKGDRRLL
jgi:hypothetical protein